MVLAKRVKFVVSSRDARFSLARQYRDYRQQRRILLFSRR
jgi:hypothetical protein